MTCEHHWIGDTCARCGVSYDVEQVRVIAELREELDRVKRQGAAMRALASDWKARALALRMKAAAAGEQFKDDYIGKATAYEYAAADISSIQRTAGSDLLTREQVKPLVECLEHIKTTALECREAPKVVLAAVGLSACSGVAHAKTLGL